MGQQWAEPLGHSTTFLCPGRPSSFCQVTAGDEATIIEALLKVHDGITKVMMLLLAVVMMLNDDDES
jgi:hypothetical protein